MLLCGNDDEAAREALKAMPPQAQQDAMKGVAKSMGGDFLKTPISFRAFRGFFEARCKADLLADHDQQGWKELDVMLELDDSVDVVKARVVAAYKKGSGDILSADTLRLECFGEELLNGKSVMRDYKLQAAPCTSTAELCTCKEMHLHLIEPSS